MANPPSGGGNSANFTAYLDVEARIIEPAIKQAAAFHERRMSPQQARATAEAGAASAVAFAKQMAADPKALASFSGDLAQQQQLHMMTLRQASLVRGGALDKPIFMSPSTLAGQITPQQSFAQFDIQRAETARLAALKTVLTGETTTFRTQAKERIEVEPGVFETHIGGDIISQMKSASTLKTQLKDLEMSSKKKGYLKGFVSKQSAIAQQFIQMAEDPSLSNEERAFAIEQANIIVAEAGARSKRGFLYSEAEAAEKRRKAKTVTQEASVAKEARRVEKLAAFLPSNDPAVVKAQQALAGRLAADPRDPEQVATAKKAYEQAYADLQTASIAARPTSETMRNQLQYFASTISPRRDILAGKLATKGLKLTPDQAKRLAGIDWDINEAMTLGQSTNYQDQVKAKNIQDSVNANLRAFNKEIDTSIKSIKAEANARLYKPREALGMAMVTRSISGRITSVGTSMAGADGSTMGAVAAGQVASMAGGLQDLALNNFIQNRTGAGFAGLIAASALSTVSSIFSSFAQRGIDLRNQTASIRAGRHLELGTILASSGLTSRALGGSLLPSIQPGTEFSALTSEPFSRYGVSTSLDKTLSSGAAYLGKDYSTTGPFGPRGVSSKYAQFLEGMTSKYTLTREGAQLAQAGVRSALLQKERDMLTNVITRAQTDFGYGGLVSADEMLKATSAISSEGLKISELAKRVYTPGKSKIYYTPYMAGVSELAFGAYATAISKSSGLTQNLVNSAMAMQGLGMANAGLGVGRFGNVYAQALDTFANAIQTKGLPSITANQILSTAMGMNREGMFTDLTSLAAHTRGLAEAGITPGTIGLVKTTMMQSGRSAYNQLRDPYKNLSNSMALLRALQMSGGDPLMAMEAARTMDTSSPEHLAFLQANVSPYLAAGTVMSSGGAYGDVTKWLNAKSSPAPKRGLADDLMATAGAFVTAITGETPSWATPLPSTLMPGQIAANLDKKRQLEADKTTTEEGTEATVTAKLESIAITLARIADSLGNLL